VVDRAAMWEGVFDQESIRRRRRDPLLTILLLLLFQVIGDATPEASKLMKREGVRSVPSFHYFVNGEKVDVVNGANAEAIESTITKHVSP
jgi:hypothetical protein